MTTAMARHAIRRTDHRPNMCAPDAQRALLLTPLWQWTLLIEVVFILWCVLTPFCWT
jgi:hypothetical protein